MTAWAELHVHLEGTLEPELIFALARRNGLTLPYADVEDLRSRYDFGDLQEFLDLYYANMTVLQRREDFADLTDAYLARAARAGVRRAEVFFDLQAHTGRGVPAAEALEGVSSALSLSYERYGISSGLIVTLLRHLSAESAMEAYEQAVASGVPLLGIGLCSTEVGNPASRFREVFARAQADGLHTVAHAGEVRVREVGEVLAALQDLHVGVVEIEEFLQVAEVVPRSQVLDPRIGQADAVAPRQREDQLWLEGPLEVYVQLRPRGHRQPPTSCVRSSSTVIALLAWRR